MNKMEKVSELIKGHMSDAIVETRDLVGDMDNLHLDLIVASSHFAGKTLIEQHQLIMDILKESLKSEIHAVKLKTMTLETYKKLKN
jgi:stress-induced morphogen